RSGTHLFRTPDNSVESPYALPSPPFRNTPSNTSDHSESIPSTGNLPAATPVAYSPLSLPATAPPHGLGAPPPPPPPANSPPTARDPGARANPRESSLPKASPPFQTRTSPG